MAHEILTVKDIRKALRGIDKNLSIRFVHYPKDKHIERIEYTAEILLMENFIGKPTEVEFCLRPIRLK